MRHYIDWLTGVKDGRYNRTRLTWLQWQQIRPSYRYYGLTLEEGKRRQRLSRRSYLRGYARGLRARLAYKPLGEQNEC